MRGNKILLTAALAIALLPQAASSSLVDFIGYSWETGGFPSSDPQDALDLVGRVTGITEPLTWQPGLLEYTLYLGGLESQGEEQVGDNLLVTYTGGALEIYSDKAFDADYGVHPPNALAPSTFTNGHLYARFDVTAFSILYNPIFMAGTFNGLILVGQGGTHEQEFAGFGEGVTFGGLFEFGTPEGYDLQWSGSIDLDTALPVAETTWGDIKQLYR